MALTVKQLIEKLEKVEDKTVDTYFETSDSIFSVDRVILDEDNEILFVSDIGSHHCLCDECKANETKL